MSLTDTFSLDLHHEVFLLLLSRKLHLAPIKNPHRILDLGTGTGLWAVDMADKYPSALVIGTDLSPIQPHWVPPNWCILPFPPPLPTTHADFIASKFEVDDADCQFTFESDYFDLVHARNISQGIKDFDNLAAQMFRVTTPGGYAELGELGFTVFSDDGTMAPDNGIKIYCEKLEQAMITAGRPPMKANDLKSKLENAGFIDVRTKTFKQPFGPWTKDKVLKQVGAFNVLQCSEGGAFHSYGMAAFTRVLGMSKDDAEVLCRNAIRDTRNKNYHTYNQ